jgi:ribosome-associated protein
LEKIIASLKKRPKATTRIDRESRLFQTILNAIQEKKGEHIVSLDLRKIEEAVADFFILCEAGSDVQIRAIADKVEEDVWANCDEKAYHKETGEAWTLLDYVNIVVHIFKPEERKFYDLESLWMDSEQMEHA